MKEATGAPDQSEVGGNLEDRLTPRFAWGQDTLETGHDDGYNQAVRLWLGKALSHWMADVWMVATLLINVTCDLALPLADPVTSEYTHRQHIALYASLAALASFAVEASDPDVE